MLGVISVSDNDMNLVVYRYKPEGEPRAKSLQLPIISQLLTVNTKFGELTSQRSDVFFYWCIKFFSLLFHFSRNRSSEHRWTAALAHSRHQHQQLCDVIFQMSRQVRKDWCGQAKGPKAGIVVW